MFRFRLLLVFLVLHQTDLIAEPLHTAEAPLPPLEAAQRMIVPPGFHVSLFAGEPDVKQPIGFCIDDRGRLWVAEAYNYPVHGTRPGDRLLIFEDTNGDGKFDKRKVFYDKLNYVTGIEVGFGGVWVMSPPYFYFIPDQDGDDRPDTEPQVLLDGFGNHANSHNLANAFAWGPDGWLYGTHGRTNYSLLGKPGTPEKDRVQFDGGVYRYHPVRHVWEPFADGTTNPWGIDWNDYGEAFTCNCVNPHLFHVIQGAHYEPWRNRKSSQYAYERIPTIADHLHFVGTQNVRDGLGSHEEDLAGGGHAHCGTMIYLGDNWPKSYRNSIFMNNIHGRRINNDVLHRSGSGYRASHGRDLMRSQDPWFMGVTLAYGPDGAVYVSDWSDTGECHSVRDTRRHTGRIFKITYGKPEFLPVDLSQLSNQELVQLQLRDNDWHVRHARRILQERAAKGQDVTKIHQQLIRMFHQQTAVPKKLRALWALHATQGLTDDFLVSLLDADNEHLRAWAVRLLCEDQAPPLEAITRFITLAKEGKSPFVRLSLASALQRLNAEQKWPIAEALVTRGEDADDVNLPLMIWYGIEPLFNEDLDQFVALASRAEIPLVRRHVARRVASEPMRLGLKSLVDLLGSSENDQWIQDILSGLLKGLEGSRTIQMPANWPEAYAKLNKNARETIRQDSLRLALIFDDPVAYLSLRELAEDTKESRTHRNRALQSLIEKKPADLSTLLLALMRDPATQDTALKGLAECDGQHVSQAILGYYPSLKDAGRQHALQTLASRAAWARELLDAVDAGTIAPRDLTAYTARQLRSLEDQRITARVQELWGNVRDTPAARAKLIAQHKQRLTNSVLDEANLADGRALFQKHCANCHKFFGEGETIGPDITGAQRTNLDYLLENLLDPSAAVAKDFQMEKIATISGRIVTGLVVEEQDVAITVRTINERIIIPTAEIEERARSQVSIMPEGLLEKLSPRDIRDLIGYLMGPGPERKSPH